MIEQAKNLSEINKEILIAYLHFLHMNEHLHRVRPWDWVYRNIQAHWVRAEVQAHWVGL